MDCEHYPPLNTGECSACREAQLDENSGVYSMDFSSGNNNMAGWVRRNGDSDDFKEVCVECYLYVYVTRMPQWELHVTVPPKACIKFDQV